MKFRIAINRSFRGKPTGQDLTAFFREYNGRFTNLELSDDELLAEVTAGHGLTTWHKGYRAARNFICGQHLGLDFDTGDERSAIDQLVADPFIGSFASILYSTPSHTADAPRSRALFLLDRPIYDPALYAEAATALLWKFGQADQSCKDPARLFFGAGADPITATSGNILPWHVVENDLLMPFLAWRAANLQQRQQTAALRRVVASGDVPAAMLRRHSEALLENVRTAPDGAKHVTLRDIARTFGGYVATGHYDPAEAERWLQDAIRANPGKVKSLQAADHTIRQGLEYGRLQPLDFTLSPTDPAPIPAPPPLTRNTSWRAARA